MKKNYLAMAALACGLLSFSACSSDDDFGGDEQTSVATGELCDVTVNFNFEVSGASTTRAGRPLWSQEALQQVNDMHLYLFKNEGADEEAENYKFVKEITDGSDGAAANGNFGFNNTTAAGTEEHTYVMEDKLTAGNYKVLAVGFEEETNASKSGTTYTPLAFTANTTTLAAAQLDLASGKKAEEVFSGVSEKIDVQTDKQKFNVGVTLTRTVAGVLGYFKNIPYTIGGTIVKHVFVKAAAEGKAALLANGGIAGTNGGEYNIIDINLDGKQHGVVEGKEIYKNAANAYGAGVTVVENSFLQGAYALPIAAQTTTLKVVLTGEDTNVALATYPVKINKAEGLGSGFTADSQSFPLNANYFYSIGQKLKNNSDGSETDDDPSDDDDPIDLSIEQEIVITVSASWAKFVDLGLVIE